MPSQSRSQTEVTITMHPPERRRPGGTVVVSCACCSCCCCCLHTIGGLIGAVAGSVGAIPEHRPPPHLDELDSPYALRRDEFEDDNLLPPQLVYWFTVLVTICATAVIYFLADGSSLRPADSLLTGTLVALMILPGLQLGASLLSALILLLFAPNTDRALRRIGRITLWSLVGTMIGCAAMGGCCGVLMIGR